MGTARWGRQMGLGPTFPTGTPRCPGVLIDEKLTLLVEDPREFCGVSTRENIVECAGFWENETYVSQLVSLMHTGVGESKPCEKERAMGGIFISYDGKTAQAGQADWLSISKNSLGPSPFSWISIRFSQV